MDSFLTIRSMKSRKVRPINNYFWRLLGHFPARGASQRAVCCFPSTSVNFAFIRCSGALCFLREISLVLEILRLTSYKRDLVIKSIGRSRGWATTGFSSGRCRASPGETRSAQPEGSHPFPRQQGCGRPQPLVPVSFAAVAATWQLLLLGFGFFFLILSLVFFMVSQLSASITRVNIDVLLKEV